MVGSCPDCGMRVRAGEAQHVHAPLEQVVAYQRLLDATKYVWITMAFLVMGGLGLFMCASAVFVILKGLVLLWRDVSPFACP